MYWTTGASGGTSFPPPTAAGQIPTSTDNTIAHVSWDVPGGFVISSFSGGSTIEVGDTRTNPAFTAAYSETPNSAQITNTAGLDSPHLLVAPCTNATIAGVFGPLANGASVVFTLSATHGTTTKTATSSITGANPIRYGVSNAPAATQAFIAALASQQLHTARGGTYAFNAGAGQFCCFAVPAAYGTPTLVDSGGFQVIPTLVGTTNYTTAFGIVISDNVYTAGASGIGAVSFTMS